MWTLTRESIMDFLHLVYCTPFSRIREEKINRGTTSQVRSWFDELTTSGYGILEINYLAVRPELVEGRAPDCDTVSERGEGSINAISPSCRTWSGIQRPLKELDSGFRRNDDLFGNRQFMNRLWLNKPIARLLPALDATIKNFGVFISQAVVKGCFPGSRSVTGSGAVEGYLLILCERGEPRLKFSEGDGSFEVEGLEFLIVFIGTNQDDRAGFQFLMDLFWTNPFGCLHS